MIRGTLFLSLILFLLSLDSLYAKEPPAIAISLVKLLVNPELYNGAHVQVVGFAYEGVSIDLYLTKDHAKISDFLSSIRIIDTMDGDIISSGCLPGYIKVRGKFTRTRDGDYAIVDVTSIYKSGYGSCWDNSNGK